MPATSAFDCPVCLEQYDEERRTPLLLGVCGHTTCRACLLRMELPRRCGECRAALVKPVSSLVRNYALLQVSCGLCWAKGGELGNYALLQ